ncbi:MAG: hemolysin III family protein [Desulfovibrio sp.]|nr:MAG: hemolysin III family protein [Desulfovibrio sp.]
MTIRVHDPLAGLIHFLGFGLSIAGLTILVTQSAFMGEPWRIVSFSVFGAGLVLLYLASTLCHWLPVSGRVEQWFEKFDHVMIYVLIAATYTPVCLVPLRGGWGWSVFGVIWGLALAGAALKLLRFNTPRWVTSGFYLAMGWMFLVAMPVIAIKLSGGAIMWLMIGGACYSVGGIVYAVKWPDPWPMVFGFHEIFHIFVLAGSLAHFFMMLFHVLPG